MSHTLNDLASMDDLIYRTSTVAYDTCLADRPQTQDDIKQELADPTPRKYRFRPRDRLRPALHGGARFCRIRGRQGSDGSSHDDVEEPEDLDEPMDEDVEEIPPPPLEQTLVVFHANIGPGEAAPIPPPPSLLPFLSQPTSRRLVTHLKRKTWRSTLVSLTLNPSWRLKPINLRPEARLVVVSLRPKGALIPPGGQPSSKSMARREKRCGRRGQEGQVLHAEGPFHWRRGGS